MNRQQRRQSGRALVRRVHRHNRPSDRDKARHEAGHLVACVHYGIAFDHVTMDGFDPHPERGYAWTGGVVDMVLTDPRTGAVALWAGPAAEGHIYNSAHDLTLIQRLAPNYVTDRWPGSPHAVAHRLVAARADDIACLAAALAVERTMTSARVLEVLG